MSLFEKAKRAFTRNVRQEPEVVILGDSSGRLHPAGKSHLWLVRRTTDSPAFTVEWSGHGALPPRAGIKVVMRPDYDGVVRLFGRAAAEARQENPAGVNADNPNDKRISQYTNPLSGILSLLTRSVTNANTPSKKVTVWSATLIDETGIRMFGGAQINLASYIPAANEHRMVMLWLTVDNVIRVTASTTKSVILPLSSVDWLECVNAIESSAMPVAVYRLANNQSAITDANRMPLQEGGEIRQILNPPRRLGNPNPVTRIERVEAGRQIIYWGAQLDGRMILDGHGVVL